MALATCFPAHANFDSAFPATFFNDCLNDPGFHSIVVSSFLCGWFLKPHFDEYHFPQHWTRWLQSTANRWFTSLLRLPVAGGCTFAGDQCRLLTRSRDFSLALSRDFSLVCSSPLISRDHASYCGFQLLITACMISLQSFISRLCLPNFMNEFMNLVNS